MDENTPQGDTQQPQQPNVEQQANVPQPQQPVQAQDPVAQTQPTSVAPQQPMQAAPASIEQSDGKSKLPLILGIVGAVLLVIAILGAVWFFFFNPATLAKNASNEFVSAATSGDIDTLLVLNDGENEDFLKGMIESVESSTGSYSLIDSTSNDGVYYFLYDLDDAKSERIRITVEKVDGKWSVTSAVFGGEKIALVPGQAIEEDSDTEPTAEEPTSTPTATLACLEQDDYRYMTYNKEVPSVTYDLTLSQPGAYATNYIANMYFEPDSIVEATNSSTYDDWAEFGTKLTDKAWKFILKGTIFTRGQDSYTNDADYQLAMDRAGEVKRELVTRGVDEARIIIDEPINNADEYVTDSDGTYFDGEIFRRVELTVDPTCDQSSASTTEGR